MHELIILGILQENELHGYQLKRYADRLLAGFYEVSYGTLYPKFKKLEQNQFISSRSMKSNGGQEKIHYQLTGEGKIYFLKLMEDIPNETFPVKWARFKIKLLFFAYIDKDIREHLVMNMLQNIENEIIKLKEIQKNSGLDKYQKLIIIRNINELNQNYEWLSSIK